MEIYRVKFNTNIVIDTLTAFRLYKKILKGYNNTYKLFEINHSSNNIIFTRKYNYNVLSNLKKKYMLEGKITIYYK